jgi:predicted ABC-type ATPase
MKKLYILSGCNGCGQNNRSLLYFTGNIQCREFVNADEIAKGLSPFQLTKLLFKQVKIMIKRIKSLIEQGK